LGSAPSASLEQHQLWVAPRAPKKARETRVGKTSDFPKIGSSLEFDFGGSPAIAVRTATAQASGLTFVALSRICTHLGCTLNLPDGAGNMGCGCHGSVFQVQTGAVVNGPANKPLASIKLELRGTDLYAVGV
jgi:Rieske Fe-S protein